MRAIKLILIDNHKIFVESLELVLSSNPNFEIVNTFYSGKDALHFLENGDEVDLIISDLQMASLSGIDLTIQVKKQYPQIKVILLTMIEDIHTIKYALQIGVDGYVLKSADKQTLERAITAVIEGEHFFSEEVLKALIDYEKKHLCNHQYLPSQLTKREIEVLQLISDEHTTQSIADKLFISIPTVETHRRNLMQKLNVKNVIGMVKYAFKHGIASISH